MTTAMVKGTTGRGLVKTSKPIRQLEARLERARQSFNEKVKRAEADYWDAVKRAAAMVSESEEQAPPAESVEGVPAASANGESHPTAP